MGLLYTKFHMNFDEEEWNQISNNPIVFQTIKNDVTLEIEDTSHKSYCEAHTETHIHTLIDIHIQRET